MNKAEYLIELDKKRRNAASSDERWRLSLDIRERERHLDEFERHELTAYIEYLEGAGRHDSSLLAQNQKGMAEALRAYRDVKYGAES